MPTLIFDCDGVLADTERYGHLPAFNATFEEFGLPSRWDEEEYAERLQVGGGKERMATLFRDPGFVEAAGIPDDEKERSDLLLKWHRTKTAHFKRMVADGELPPRPGIARLIPEALDAGWTVTESHLEVVGKIPGGSAEAFRAAAEAAEKGCPISRLLNTKITMEAKLEG